jgi:hypothetical protein
MIRRTCRAALIAMLAVSLATWWQALSRHRTLFILAILDER